MSISHQQQSSSRLPNNTSTSSSSYLSVNSLTGASAATSVTSPMYSMSNNNNNNSNLDIYLTKLQEDQQHDRLAKNQKSKLLQKNLESLRGLVSEIQADDWKYSANNNDHHDETVMSEYFTRVDAWGTDQTKRGGGN